MFGDFGQLPPILDLPMFSNDASHDINSNNDIVAYKHLLEAYKLDVVQRQSGNSEKQKEFRDLLLRLREGDSTIEDWN